MPYFLDGNCVRKGTKEEPGETVKCHDTHEEAVAHMQALYVNVEDAKGGPGSGWHAPAEGTHTAANAPNFAGGPGADRVYDGDDDKPPKSKRCKCSKCGAVRLLEKGKQCSDMKCPACGGEMSQTEPRRDKPAEGEEGGAPSAGRKKAVHGEGSMLGEVTAVMGQEGEAECKCPHCGKAVPCTAVACPFCKERIEEEKAMWTVYKSADGTLRWLALCNWAVVDREHEVISEKAYQDGIAHAQKTGQWGELDLVHVRGSDVGDCDTLFIAKQGDEPAKLGAGGTWRDTSVAAGAHQAVQERPAYWGMSERFAYNPRRKVRGIYTGEIRYLKHTILPRAMAASHGTAIAVEGGQSMKELSEDQRKALAELNVSEEQIEEWAEKQKTLPPEENVAEKDETAEEEAKADADAPEKAKFFAWLEELVKSVSAKKDTPVASESEEAGKADEVTDPAKAAEPAETKQAGGEGDTSDMSEMLKAVGAEMAKSLGELVQAELATRDEQIAGLEEQIKALHISVEDKVNERLRDVPPVVTVEASQVQATVQGDGQPRGLTFGQAPEVAEKYTAQFLESIERLVDQRVKGVKYQA